MKTLLLIVLVLIFAGCVSEQIQSLVADPHYASYQQKLDSVEQTYLRKEITYAQYLEKKKEIDEQYSKEVQKREQIIHGQNQTEQNSVNPAPPPLSP